MIKEGDDEDKS